MLSMALKGFFIICITAGGEMETHCTNSPEIRGQNVAAFATDPQLSERSATTRSFKKKNISHVVQPYATQSYVNCTT